MTDLERLFHGALAVPAGGREAYVWAECGADEALAARVLSMLAHHEQSDTSSIAAPVGEAAADLWATAELTPGAALGPYRVERKLGAGGMGVVHAAIDTRLDRRVALKIIGGLLRDAAARERFHREARAAAALSHPHIAVLYEFGESAAGEPWMAMEFVEGASLRERLAGGGLLSRELARRFAGQLASALDHAHASGIVHCDIKPENILISSGGQLKVIDFGIAAAWQRGEGSLSNGFGTRAYTAPEVLAGEPVTPRADIYSAGLVLRELLGEGVATEIIERCLAQDPARRFRDGGRLAAALAALPENADDTPVLAVLEFENLSAEGAVEDWLAAGLAETLTTRLARLPQLRVASRRRLRQLVGDGMDAAAVAGAVGARWIIEGTYQRLGDQMRVTANLVHTRSGAVRHAEAVDGLWADLFAVQDRLAEKLARAIAGQSASMPRLGGAAPHLGAYEHYARGRQCMYRMDLAELATAIGHFEQALALDPNYALCHSALGTAHCLRFLHASDPEDVRRGAACLERAIALDPELGEPYPWLANLRVRQNNPAGAFEAARLGVERQPDLPESQYFAGGLHYMLAETPLSSLATGARQLAEAIRLEPRFHPAWMGLGAICAFAGRHDEAVRLFTETARTRNAPDRLYPFVGGEAFRAIAWMRAGQWERSREGFHESIAALRAGPHHLYRDCFLILSVVGLGELALRTDEATEVALAHFRHAWRLLSEAPRVAGAPRFHIRISAGLAATYAASGAKERARELYAEAVAQLPAVAQNTGTLTFECGLGQLHLNLAVASLRLGDTAAAVAHLEQARASRWQDAAWLRNDVELQPLREHHSFTSWLAALDDVAWAVSLP